MCCEKRGRLPVEAPRQAFHKSVEAAIKTTTPFLVETGGRREEIYTRAPQAQIKDYRGAQWKLKKAFALVSHGRRASSNKALCLLLHALLPFASSSISVFQLTTL